MLGDTSRGGNAGLVVCFRLLLHAEKQLLADAERDKCYAEPKASKVAIPPDKPEDWPRVFEQHLNVGDLDAVMALYEPEARCVSRPGETLVIPPHSPAPMRGLGGCGARGVEANS